MSQSARDLLVHGIAAAKAKDLREAHFYLEWVLQTDADHRQQIDAWWWLSELRDDLAEKREYLENILAHDMGHGPALAGRPFKIVRRFRECAACRG